DRELLGKPDALIPADDADGNAPADYPADPVAVVNPTATVTLAVTKKKKNKVVQIVNADSGRVLTVLEVLSPSNKNPGEDRDAHLAKRREYFAAGVNVVEIDLLRDGDRLPMGKPRPPAADYYVLVTRTSDYPHARVWSFSVREPMPVVPVPLDRQNPAVALDLRACLDQVYDDGSYARKLDYTQPPEPPLRKPDADWAGEFLKNLTGRS
ncbi:MAG: DUF4058 family protein, partial [Gemmataceae bacterium]|nr:DUF4058 family protein [Gemmataceae bacterium]